MFTFDYFSHGSQIILKSQYFNAVLPITDKPLIENNNKIFMHLEFKYLC